jgi:peptidase A4-like protein
MTFFALAGLAAFVLLPTAGAAASSHAPKHKYGRGTSTNWSGYAVDGNTATHVIGTWTQPAATCASGENSWSSPWVGIDGDNSSTVEQIGTDTDCQGGVPRFYAWYEMYPKSLVQISAIAVQANHSYTGEVTYTSGAFLLKLTDNTTGASFQTTQASKKAKRSSVEWVMEGPSNGLLTNFGLVGFSAASATISNQTGNLGSFGTAAQPITMVTRAGVPRATPSAVSGGTGFSVTWQHG